jgi:4-amino-4-deoxy-L-arabinose transferase
MFRKIALMFAYYFTNTQIIPLIPSVLFLLGSLLFFITHKQKISLLLLFLGSIMLGVFIATLDPFLNLWDEQYHALVAKNMLQNPLKPMLYKNPLFEYDYTNWAGNHIWLHKQPLFLWQIAMSIKFLGANTFAVRLPSIILHALTTLLIYRIGKTQNNANIGYYGALLFTVAYFPLELICGKYPTDHNDIAFLFYVTASFWAWYEYQQSKKFRWIVLLGVFSGCAVLVKWLVGLLIYPVWIIADSTHKKLALLKWNNYVPLLASFLISCFVFIPWQLYIFNKFPLEATHEFLLNTKHFYSAVEGHGGNSWFHFKALNKLYGSGDLMPYILLAGVILLVLKTSTKNYRIATISAIVIVYGFYTIAATKMIAFCIIASPFIFLGLGALLDTFISFLKEKIKPHIFGKTIEAFIIIAACFFLIDLNKIENYHTNKKPHDNFGREKDLKEMEVINKLLHISNIQNYVVFNANISVNGHISTMYYTNCIAYDFIPDEKQIEQIQNKSHKIIVINNNSLPNYILNNNSIIKLNP